MVSMNYNCITTIINTALSTLTTTITTCITYIVIMNICIINPTTIEILIIRYYLYPYYLL